MDLLNNWKVVMDSIQIGFLSGDQHKEDSARILYEAFQRKLYPVLKNPEKAKKLLAVSLRPSLIIGAKSGNTLLGVAGLAYRGNTFCRASIRDCFHHLGLARGILGWIVLNLFMDGTCTPADLRIAALAVDDGSRSQGIGTQIIQRVFEYASSEGFQAVRLEVVDTNQDALRLYKRLGFETVRTIRFGILRDWLGFSAEIEMIHALR
jgi:ribosomal protein S18 acetylase RimI-like enzyme